MAIYILIKKASETDDWVDYEFWEDEGNVGRLRLDKKAGKAIELREIEGSTPKQSSLAQVGAFCGTLLRVNFQSQPVGRHKN